MEWSEVKAKFLSLIKDPQWSTQRSGLRTLVGRLRTPHIGGEDFSGGTPNETVDWLTNGYHSDAFTTNNVAAVPRRRKRAAWGEEDGEPDAGRLLGGADAFYLTRSPRDARPGLTIDAECIFSAAVDVEIVQAYGAFIASLVGTLEAEGYDLEVAITQPTGGVWNGMRRERRCTEIVRVLVKRANEVSDFASWSALFAPTGYRHLLFTATGVAGDKVGKTAKVGLGPIAGANGWSVTNEDGRVTIGCNSSGARSPEEVTRTLTAQAKAAGLLR